MNSGRGLGIEPRKYAMQMLDGLLIGAAAEANSQLLGTRRTFKEPFDQCL